MTPRPQVPQQGTASSNPRLQPIARPTGRGGGGGAGVTGQAADFASLSESLTKAITSIKRVGLEERREDEFLAGQAAAEEAPAGLSEKELVDQGLIPKSASKSWRKGFFNIQGRNQADRFRQEVLDPWLRESTAGEAFVDDQGIVQPRKDPLEELTRLRSEYISGLGMGSNVHFLAGYNAYAGRDIEKAADAYTTAANNFEELRANSLIVADAANSLEAWFEDDGPLPTEGNLAAFRDKIRSSMDTYGVPLGDDMSALMFASIQQFVREAVQDEDMDLDAVSVYVETLLSTNGYNGNTNFSDDPRYSEKTTKLLNDLDRAEDAAFTRRQKERAERKVELHAEAERKYGAGQYDAAGLFELKADLANGAGEFEGISEDDQEILLGYWSTLTNNVNNQTAAQRTAQTRRVEDYLTSRVEFLSEDQARSIITSQVGVDRAALFKVVGMLYGEEETELRLNVERKMDDPAVKGATKSSATLFTDLPTGDRAVFEEQQGDLLSALRRELTNAYEQGREEDVGALMQRFMDESENLSRRARERKQELDSELQDARSLRDRGSFEDAQAAFEGLDLTEDQRQREFLRLEAARERENDEHTIEGNGLVSELFARAYKVLPESGGFLNEMFGEAEFESPGIAKKRAEAAMDAFGQQLESLARDYRKENRSKAASYSEYREGLQTFLTQEFNAVIATFASPEEQAAIAAAPRAEGSLAGRLRQVSAVQNLATSGIQPYAVSPEVQASIEKAQKTAGESQVTREFRQGDAVIEDIDPAREGPDMSFDEALRANEFFYLEDTQGSARSVEEFRFGTTGFSPQEFRDGAVTVEIPETVKERLRASRQAVESFQPGIGYDGLRSSLPGWNAVADNIDYFFFPSMDQVRQRRQSLLDHYDRLLASESRSVSIDTRRIARAVAGNPKGVLVFQTEDQIAAFESDPNHVYRRAFNIPAYSAGNFADRQRELLAQKKAEGYFQ